VAYSERLELTSPPQSALELSRHDVSRLPLTVFPINASRNDVKLFIEAVSGAHKLANDVTISEGFRIPTEIERSSGDERVVKQYQFERYSIVRAGSFVKREDRRKVIPDSMPD